MKPIMQTITGRGPKFDEPCGNCLQAALASVLELPLDEVPHFCDSPDPDDSTWYTRMNAWLSERLGLAIVYLRASDAPDAWMPTGFHLLSGTSPRGSQHETVGYNGVLVHDPHPVGGGVNGDLFYGVFVVTNPAHVESLEAA